MHDRVYFSDWIVSKSGDDAVGRLAEFVKSHPLPQSWDRKTLRDVLREKYAAAAAVLKDFDVSWRVFRS